MWYFVLSLAVKEQLIARPGMIVLKIGAFWSESAQSERRCIETPPAWEDKEEEWWVAGHG
jgi:hypothetical protein